MKELIQQSQTFVRDVGIDILSMALQHVVLSIEQEQEQHIMYPRLDWKAKCCNLNHTYIEINIIKTDLITLKFRKQVWKRT